MVGYSLGDTVMHAHKLCVRSYPAQILYPIRTVLGYYSPSCDRGLEAGARGRGGGGGGGGRSY